MAHRSLYCVAALHITYAITNVTEWTPSLSNANSPQEWSYHRGFFAPFDNSIYLLGRSNPWRFNIETETWSTITGNGYTSVDLDGQYGAVIGSVFYFQNYYSQQNIYKFDPENSIWDPSYLSMPDGNGKCFTSNKQDTVYILGAGQQFMKFNVSNNPVTLDYGTNIDGSGNDFGQCGYYKGYIYMFGGKYRNEIKKNDIGENNEYWNQNSWITLSVTMPVYGLHFGEAVLIGDIFYMAGFESQTGTAASKYVYAFDVLRETFIYASDFNTYRRGTALIYSSYDDKLYAMLGKDLNNYEYSNILHTNINNNIPTFSPSTYTPTSITLSPTTSYPTITKLNTVINNNIWNDDYKLINHPMVLGWNMSVVSMINGSNSIYYYGPFTEMNSKQDYYIYREFECLYDSNVRLHFKYSDCNTWDTDWIDINFAGVTIQISQSSSTPYNTDPFIQSYCNYKWLTGVVNINGNTVYAKQIFNVLFHIRITETEDFILIYDISINCDIIGTLPPTRIPTGVPTHTHPITVNTTQPTTLNPTVTATTFFTTDMSIKSPTIQYLTTTYPTSIPVTKIPTLMPTKEGHAEVKDLTTTTGDIISTIEHLDNQSSDTFVLGNGIWYIMIGIIICLCLCLCILFLPKLRQYKTNQTPGKKYAISPIEMHSVDKSPQTTSITHIVSASSFNGNAPQMETCNTHSLLIMDINFDDIRNSFQTAGGIDNESNKKQDVNDDIIGVAGITTGEIMINKNDMDVYVEKQIEGTDTEETLTDDNNINDQVIGNHLTPLPPSVNRVLSESVDNNVAMDPIVIGDDENVETAGH
eukprot:339522_1